MNSESELAKGVSGGVEFYYSKRNEADRRKKCEWTKNEMRACRDERKGKKELQKREVKKRWRKGNTIMWIGWERKDILQTSIPSPQRTNTYFFMYIEIGKKVLKIRQKNSHKKQRLRANPFHPKSQRMRVSFKDFRKHNNIMSSNCWVTNLTRE